MTARQVLAFVALPFFALYVPASAQVALVASTPEATEACGKCEEESPTGRHKFGEAGVYFNGGTMHTEWMASTCGAAHILGCGGPSEQQEQSLEAAIARQDAAAARDVLSELPGVLINEAAGTIDMLCPELGVLVARYRADAEWLTSVASLQR